MDLNPINKVQYPGLNGIGGRVNTGRDAAGPLEYLRSEYWRSSGHAQW
jgi:hypothetical protein